MADDQRRRFIGAFENVPQQTGVRVIGFAVMGGIFGEGIDLVGHRLGGVICVGTGMPQLGSEAELVRAYFDARDEAGFYFAYLYPGFNRVMQAAGRLIRTEADTGFILMVDERYLDDLHQSLLPMWWNPHVIEDLDELETYLDETPPYIEPGDDASVAAETDHSQRDD